MRTTSIAPAVAVVCLAVGAAAAGCADGTTDQELSAGQMLDHANGAMRGLTSVTIDAVSTVDPGDDYSSRLTTDLKARCAFTSTSVKGAGLEQIRIGRTDYVRPNRAYLKQSGRDMPGKGEQNRWIKTPASEAQPGDGLAECTQDFTSFGVATKGRPTKVNGSKAVPLIVTDKADKGGSYTFYIATEGKPYILKTVYKGAKQQTTTTFSAFDKPLDVRPPAEADVMEVSGIGR